MAPFVIGSQKEKARDNTTPLEQRLGQSTSVVIPLLELGAIGYISWVICYLICTQYLINPSTNLQQSFNVEPRRGAGIAIIVIYAVLLFLLLLPWMRLLQVIWSNPDILPLGDPSVEQKDASTKFLDKYDAYVSDYEGNPLYCQKCHIYKRDRTHHCKELGRCVRKMDHYCPWAGGIISESTHKFFMQFVFFGALYTTFVWLVTAVLLADRISKTGNRPSTWIGALAVGLMFCIFSFTMTCMTGYNLCINYTSVEAIQRGGVSNIAFLLSRFPEHSNPSTPPTSSKDANSSDADDDWAVLRIIERGPGRSYVVMQSRPFQHPWMGSMMQGWKDTMGNSFWEWITPFKMSPCRKRTRAGEFRWGTVIYDMAEKYERDNPGARLAILEGLRK